MEIGHNQRSGGAWCGVGGHGHVATATRQPARPPRCVEPRPCPAPFRRRLRAAPQDGVPQRLRGSSQGPARGGRRTTSRGASTSARAPSPCSATAAPCSPSGPRPRPAPATTPLLIGIGHAARGCDDEAPSPCAAPKGGPRHGARPTKTFRREPPLAPHYKRLESESVFEPAKALHPGFCTQGRITPPSTRPPSPFPYSLFWENSALPLFILVIHLPNRDKRSSLLLHYPLVLMFKWT